MKLDPGIDLTIRDTIFTGNEGESEVRYCALGYIIPGCKSVSCCFVKFILFLGRRHFQ